MVANGEIGENLPSQKNTHYTVHVCKILVHSIKTRPFLFLMQGQVSAINKISA